jgi:hypothetical protein
MKAKAAVSVAKPKTAAFASNLGGLAEWLNAPVCKTGNRACPTVQGFKSLTRRHLASPVMALTTTRELNRTAEAARSRKISIGFLAVKLNRRFHSVQTRHPNTHPDSLCFSRRG